MNTCTFFPTLKRTIRTKIEKSLTSQHARLSEKEIESLVEIEMEKIVMRLVDSYASPLGKQ